MGLRFEVLGPVRAWRDDQEVDLGSPQQRALLAVLLLRHGGTAGPDELVTAIWGEAPPQAAVGMIRSYVSRLRRVLNSPAITSVGGGYAIHHAAVDLLEFQALVGKARDTKDFASRAAALRAALDLWQGTPLAGIRGDYAQFERTRLAELRIAAVEDLAAADIELGRHVQAAADLAGLVSEEPFRERPRELLMLALYRSGRQADALAVYHETQRVLADELGIDPGPDLRAMHARILGADPALTARTPAQLPPDLPDFVGRAGMFATIVEAIPRSVVGIEGLAGVGKTALAVHVAHAVAGSFPDGQFFVDMSVPDDPLPGLLRSLGLTPPTSAAERVALWRTHTAGRRILLVLDGVRSADQVLSLLPSGGGVVLTARQRLFSVPGVRWVTVDGLPLDEARTLLERIVGPDRLRAEPEMVDRMLVNADGLPHAIRVMGIRLTSRPGWSLETAFQRLRRPEPGVFRSSECHEVERPFESVLAELTAEQARAFRLVALADGPDISLDAAAALLDMPVVAAGPLLESLVDVHLVTADGDRYSYPAPVRGFARGRALTDDGEKACQAALARLVRFYATSARPVPKAG